MTQQDEMNDIAKAQTKEAEELAELFRYLTASPAWTKFKELGEKHVQVRMTQVMTKSDAELKSLNPPTNIDRLCGEACGIRLALSLPELYLISEENLNGLETENSSTNG